MKKRIKCILLVALLLLLFSCSEKSETSVFDVLPSQTAIMVESRNSNEFVNAMRPYFQSADILQSFEKEFFKYDSIFSLDERLAVPVKNAQFVFSVSKLNEKYEPLVVAKLNKPLSNKDLKKVFEANGKSLEYKNLGNSEFFCMDSLCVFTKGAFLFFTRNETMAYEVFEQFDSPQKMSDNADFQRVRSTFGNNVNTHVYLNYSLLGDFASASVSDRYAKGGERLAARSKGLAAFDMLVKNEGVVLNGYSKSADSSSYLKPLKYQLPVRNSIVNILPYNTKMMLHYGMSDFASYWEEVADKQSVEKLNKRIGMDVKTQFVATLSEASYSVFGNASYPVLIVRMEDPSTAIQFWTRMISKFGVSETVESQGFTIFNLNVENFVPDVFGSRCSALRKCCYSIVDQYLVIANEVNVLQDVISAYRSGRTLDLNENFKDFQENMLEMSNISFYVSCADNEKFIYSYLGGDFLGFLKRNNSFLSHYQAFSVQFASAKDMVYTCAFLRNQSQVKEEKNVAWKLNLNAPMKGKPYIVPNPAGNTNDIVVFDTQDNMYLISAVGEIQWKNEISESPMSDVFVVDAFKNGQQQFVFNTANYVYVVDRNGNNLEGFPMKLLSKASNGLSVFDYNGTSDCRLVLCGEDRFVYNFDLSGNETEGWNRHRTDDRVLKPVQHLVADNKDFIIVTDEKGAIRILDRQGRIRIPLADELKKSQGADFYENKTNRKGIILTSDDKGDLLYISSEGNLARTDFGDFSDRHFFLYEDFNSNQDPDFIYLDVKNLWVFDRFKNILFDHAFDVEIHTKPVFFTISRNKRMLGVVSEEAREIYLIDNKGNMSVSSGLVGETPFVVGSLYNNNEVNLVTGVGNALYNYIVR